MSAVLAVCSRSVLAAFGLLFMIAFALRLPIVRSARSTHLCSDPATCSTTKRSTRMSTSTETTPTVLNVLGTKLELCCNSPQTGFYRDGFCHTGEQDFGVHTVCARVTDEFLEYSKQQGNNLISPAPQYGFPGLKEGDGWCLCASRWLEAAQAGKACPIVLAATHAKTLQTVPLELLKKYAIDA